MKNPFAKPESVARHLKIAVTGKSGTGKTCFGLDAKNHGLGPVAVLSNEAGDVHYIGNARWGGFDRLSTQSIAEFEGALTYLESNPGAYGTLVTDTVTGLYEALVDAKSKEDGSVAMRDWGLIKRKWKSLMARLNNLPINIVAVVHENDLVEVDSKGASRIVGQKLDAEKTFERNPDVLIRLVFVDGKRAGRILKDRTMTFQTGEVITEPHLGMWAKAIRSRGVEERIAPPEEIAPANEAAVDAKPDRTTDEFAAAAIIARIGQFKNGFEKTNWLKKHKPEIEALKARHPDLCEAIKAAYEASIPQEVTQ